MDKKERIKELIEKLNEASKAYYQESREIMPNFEYDALYDELVALEKETGIVLSNSPTVNVGYEVLSDLPKEAHPKKMLSLDKTKDRDTLKSWLGNEEGLLSWKLDGLTIVLTYRDGELFKAVTRGNGEIGEVITNNARVFSNIPLRVNFDGEMVLRGEAVISYEDFEKINAELKDETSKYKNPRNLCSGSVRQLSNQITKERNVRFYAFSLVSAEGMNFEKHSEEFEWLAKLGFEHVEYKKVTKDNIKEEIEWFATNIEKNEIPSDGLVLLYDDIAYGKTLGTTAKFPRDAIAFKWQDELAETTLREIEWSASRTGLINPVAIFDPVELEGTTVSRASVHNVSVMQELGLGIGDRITVYKANMIIPQIAENFTRSGNIEIPESCPVCGHKTELSNENGVKTLVCTNPDCLAKATKLLTLFVSRDAMNIDGLSEMTIDKFVQEGFIKELADLFKLDRFRDEIVAMEGFGEKSYEKLIMCAEKARKTKPERLLYALGISGIGKQNAKVIAAACGNKWERIQSLTMDELTSIEGIGDIMAKGYREYFDNPDNQKTVADLLEVLDLDEETVSLGSKLEGLTFVITGSLNTFENRDALKAMIEGEGGHVSGSVSSNTDYLINNDILSNSGKNKKAKELGIKIIPEEEVRKMLGLD